jgi:hypothetical protein
MSRRSFSVSVINSLLIVGIQFPVENKAAVKVIIEYRGKYILNQTRLNNAITNSTSCFLETKI